MFSSSLTLGRNPSEDEFFEQYFNNFYNSHLNSGRYAIYQAIRVKNLTASHPLQDRVNYSYYIRPSQPQNQHSF